MKQQDEKQTTTRQHYIPQFYMKSWLNNYSKIHYLNIKEKRIGIVGSTKSICCKDNCYELGKLEDKFILRNKYEKEYQMIEDKVAPLLKKLFLLFDVNENNSLILRKEEKELLKEFVITTYTRNPKYNLNNDVKDICNDNHLYELQEILSRMFVNKKIENNIMENIVRNIIALPNPNYSNNMLGGSLYRQIETYINDLHISILKTNNNFVFSDFPILFYDEPKLVYFPLSPNYALLFSSKNIISKPNRIYNICDEDAMFFNIGYIQLNVCEYIYSNNDTNLQQILDVIK